VLHVQRHEIFDRDGDDLICDLPISFPHAALGGEVEAPSLDGRVEVDIPPGTQTGAVFRMKGKGIKNLQGHGRGDLLVRVHVEVPAKLNTAQRAKLEEFAQLCDDTVLPLRKGFFDKAKGLFR
jgi:molecular chaperone DnaJ